MLCTQIVQECAHSKQSLYQMRNFARELPALTTQLVPALEAVYEAIDRLQQIANNIGSR